MPSAISLGYITIVAGTPQSVFDNMAGIPRSLKVRAVFCQATKGNTKQCWLQTGSTAVQSNGLTTNLQHGVILLIAVPVLTASEPTALPSGSPGSGHPEFPDIDLVDLYLDGENSGDKVLVSYLP